jgi:hypothetical protein
MGSIARVRIIVRTDRLWAGSNESRVGGLLLGLKAETRSVPRESSQSFLQDRRICLQIEPDAVGFEEGRYRYYQTAHPVEYLVEYRQRIHSSTLHSQAVADGDSGLHG